MNTVWAPPSDIFHQGASPISLSLQPPSFPCVSPQHALMHILWCRYLQGPASHWLCQSRIVAATTYLVCIVYTEMGVAAITHLIHAMSSQTCLDLSRSYHSIHYQGSDVLPSNCNNAELEHRSKGKCRVTQCVKGEGVRKIFFSEKTKGFFWSIWSNYWMFNLGFHVWVTGNKIMAKKRPFLVIFGHRRT